MIVVLAAITGVSGLLLAGVNQGTKDQRKKQLLQYVKGPAISEVLAGSENQPLDDVKELDVKALEGGKGAVSVVDIFPAYKDHKLWAVAFEVTGKGYGGDIGVIVGIDIAAEKLLGIGITAHKETPGLGARIREQGFRKGFAGLGLSGAVQVKADGGAVDAVSGATISSRGVCAAVTEAFEFYRENKEAILESAAYRG
jgi:Na+-translocating ferredoxin:NAD+ oxidoreductase subunit G